MKLLGIDPATKTGWALYEPIPGHNPRVRLGIIEADGSSDARLFADFAIRIARLFAEVEPDVVGLEAPIPSFAAGELIEDPNALIPGSRVRRQIRDERSVRRSLGLRAIILANIGARRHSRGLPSGIPYEEVTSQTWRKSFFGKGTKPPATVAPKNRRPWWKAQAVAQAKLLGNAWKFAVPGPDAAEALGIAVWLAGEADRVVGRSRLPGGTNAEDQRAGRPAA